MLLWRHKAIIINCIKLPVFIALIPFGIMPIALRLRSLARQGFFPSLIGYLPIKGIFEFTVKNSPFRYQTSRADRIGRKLFWDGQEAYEPETINALKLHLDADTVFIDVGANTGLFSLIALAYGVRHVLAIEPVPSIYSALEKNLDLNASKDKFTTRQIAISDKAGRMDFHVPYEFTFPLSGSLHAQGFRGLAGRRFPIDVRPLDDIFASLGDVTKAPLKIVVKIDVEGFEFDVMKGMAELIKKHRPVLIFECFTDAPYHEIDAFLHAKGYRLYHIGESGMEKLDALDPASVPSSQRNYMALPDKPIP